MLPVLNVAHLKTPILRIQPPATQWNGCYMNTLDCQIDEWGPRQSATIRGLAGTARKAYCARVCREALSRPLHCATFGVAQQRQLPGPSCTRLQAHRSMRYTTDSLRVTFMPSAAYCCTQDWQKSEGLSHTSETCPAHSSASGAPRGRAPLKAPFPARGRVPGQAAAAYCELQEA